MNGLGQPQPTTTIPNTIDRVGMMVDWVERHHPGVEVVGYANFPNVPTKVLLPVGHRVDLLVQDRDALLFWG